MSTQAQIKNWPPSNIQDGGRDQSPRYLKGLFLGSLWGLRRMNEMNIPTNILRFICNYFYLNTTRVVIDGSRFTEILLKSIVIRIVY